MRRPPEQIAFTTPINASGLLELEPESDLLFPFEGMGVDTTWQLALPKAANAFDYRSIADVLITMEYTALDSPMYREQVIRQLDRSVSADRGFSFRNEFADAFYDLNNPQDGERIIGRFETRRSDFPANVEDLSIQHILLFFVPREGSFSIEDDPSARQVPVANFLFTPERAADEGDAPATVGGPAMSTADGIVSTRRGNGSEWEDMIGQSPAGSWELELGDEMRSRLESGDVEEVLLVITYSGRTSAWPS
jgi:hypothetical protein